MAKKTTHLSIRQQADSRQTVGCFDTLSFFSDKTITIKSVRVKGALKKGGNMTTRNAGFCEVGELLEHSLPEGGLKKGKYGRRQKREY